MRPDLEATRSQLAQRYAGFVTALLLVFALGVYGQVSRTSQDSLRRQARQIAATAAAELPLLHHEIDEDGGPIAPRRMEPMAEAGESLGRGGGRPPNRMAG